MPREHFTMKLPNNFTWRLHRYNRDYARLVILESRIEHSRILRMIPWLKHELLAVIKERFVTLRADYQRDITPR